MYSLFQCLLAQFPQSLSPMRCAGSTVAQLHRFFEDVVLENRLDALVIEGLPASSLPDQVRLSELAQVTQNFFVCAAADLTSLDEVSGVTVLKNGDSSKERLLIISDRCFSVLLAST